MATFRTGLRAKGSTSLAAAHSATRWENDRFFAQQTLRGLGLEVAKSWSFVERARRSDFIQRRPDRYVLKFDGAQAGANNYGWSDAGWSGRCGIFYRAGPVV